MTLHTSDEVNFHLLELINLLVFQVPQDSLVFLSKREIASIYGAVVSNFSSTQYQLCVGLSLPFNALGIHPSVWLY